MTQNRLVPSLKNNCLRLAPSKYQSLHSNIFPVGMLTSRFVTLTTQVTEVTKRCGMAGGFHELERRAFRLNASSELSETKT